MPQSIALGGGRGYRWCWPALTAGGEWETRGLRGRTTTAPVQAVVPPPVPGERRGQAVAPESLASASALLRSAPPTWSPCHEQKKAMAGYKAASVGGRGGQWEGSGGGGGD